MLWSTKPRNPPKHKARLVQQVHLRANSKPIPSAPVGHPASRLLHPGTIRGWAELDHRHISRSRPQPARAQQRRRPPTSQTSPRSVAANPNKVQAAGTKPSPARSASQQKEVPNTQNLQTAEALILETHLASVASPSSGACRAACALRPCGTCHILLSN